MNPTYTILEWAKFALVGDMAATTPSDSHLAPLVASVVAELILANPCIGADPLNDLTTQADLDAFTEWAGFMVAQRYVTSGAAISLTGSGSSVKVKIGPVEETITDPNTAAFYSGFQSAANGARNRISCIREALTAGSYNVLDVAGRRRRIGTDNTIEGGLLTSGRLPPGTTSGKRSY